MQRVEGDYRNRKRAIDVAVAQMEAVQTKIQQSSEHQLLEEIERIEREIGKLGL